MQNDGDLYTFDFSRLTVGDMRNMSLMARKLLPDDAAQTWILDMIARIAQDGENIPISEFGIVFEQFAEAFKLQTSVTSTISRYLDNLEKRAEPEADQYHVRIRKDGGVSAICPCCHQRKRATEQMTTWVLFCSCGCTTEVADKPVVPCGCGECDPE